MSTDFTFLKNITLQDILNITNIKVIYKNDIPDLLSYDNNVLKITFEDNEPGTDYLNTEFTLTRYGLNNPVTIIEIIMEIFELTEDDIYID